MKSGLLPEISGHDLLGAAKKLPKDLPAERSVVIAAFKREHQGAVDRWITALAAEGIADSPLDPTFTGTSVVLEFPVMGNRWSIFQRNIDSNMASIIRNPRVLARTWTFYTNVDAFCKSTNIRSKDEISTLVINRLGEIIAHVSGELSTDGLKTILEVVNE